jgi:hypothetical protein
MRETVLCATPAAFAMSFIVAGRLRAGRGRFRAVTRAPRGRRS